MNTIDKIIDGIIAAEGGYTNNPNDAGGETMYGITLTEARDAGYLGKMERMPIEFARSVYADRYIKKPGFDRVIALSIPIAAELIDTGVNMGQKVATEFLQRALNALNLLGKHYADVVVDGDMGPSTLSALAAFLNLRGAEGERVMLTALNCLQGARYITITEARPANEDFCYGWLKERAHL